MDIFELISAMVRYFSDDIEGRHRIGYWFRLPLRQADVTSIIL